MNACSIACKTKKYVMETKQIFSGLAFHKDKQGNCNAKEQNRVAWLEFLFPRRKAEVLKSHLPFSPATPPVPNYSMLNFSTTMVIKCTYLCLCLGKKVNLQRNGVYVSLKIAREINVR